MKSKPFWTALVTSERVPSSLLLLSRDVSVAFQAAKELAGELLDGKFENNPGLLVIEAEGNSIKIEQAEDIRNFIKLKSYQGRQIVVIREAHLLNAVAANSLLKAIEEPPPGVHFILCAPALLSVLPTIRSRSQVLRVPWSYAKTADQKVDLPLSVTWWKTMLSENAVANDYEEWDFKDAESLDQIFRDGLKVAKDQILELDDANFFKAEAIYNSMHQLHRDITSHIDKTLALEHFRLEVHR